MSRFPQTEPEIAALALVVAQGLREAAEDFPAPPVDGGAPTFYRIQRQMEGAQWEDAGTATNTEQLVSNQPRGVELHYRVLAINKAGIGQPSATVTAVL